MRKHVAPATLIAALVACPLALAGSKAFTGSVSGSAPGKVEFTAAGSGDPYAKVKNFDFEDVRFSCTGEGPTTIGAVFEGAIPVNTKGKFKGVQRETGTKMLVRGRFSNARKARGVFRLVLTNPEFGECDTAEVRWSASR